MKIIKDICNNDKIRFENMYKIAEKIVKNREDIWVQKSETIQIWKKNTTLSFLSFN